MVMLCIADRYTNTRRDGSSFFKIPSLVGLRQGGPDKFRDQDRNIGAFCAEMHFTEERFELE